MTNWWARPINGFRVWKGSRSARYTLLGIVSVLGVLAFVLSAVSPADDDVQQEFVQATKSRHSVVQNCKSLPRGKASWKRLVWRGRNPGNCAFILSFPVERVGGAELSFWATTPFAYRASDRSPPVPSLAVS